jgi:predicted extracellular nuclease
MNRLLSILALSILLAAGAASGQVVISQVYGAGGNSGATYNADFVELFNRGPLAADLAGHAVQYASSTGSSWQKTDLPAFSLAPGQYFLVQMSAAGANGVPLPTPDHTASPAIAMGASAGKVALTSTTAQLSGTCPTLDVADFVGYGGAANCFEGTGPAPAPSATNSDQRAGSGCTDTDDNAADFAAAAVAPRNSSTALNLCGGGGLALVIDDVSQLEGDAGTTTYQFTVTLTEPAPVGGVSFDIATQDGTATVADGDYVANALTGQVIAEGATTFTFDVTVNGDTTVEPDETFLVLVTNVTGATVADGQGTGTILNDDFVITPVHDIQGSGASSPLVGQVVTTRGIVTAVKSNGFFLQMPDAQADGDPATSEGILVYTGGAPTTAVGDDARVTGTVAEYVPSADPFQPPLTELGNPSLAVAVLSSGNQLPTPVPLTTSLPDPAGAFDQLERLEGMRVSVAGLEVVGPTLGSVDEVNATATTNGVFFGVVTGTPRPYREAGVQLPDPLPAGSPPNVPRWDTNPEILRVDSDAAGHAALDVDSGTQLGGLAGPLDYTFRHYTVDLEASAIVVANGGAEPTPVTAPAAWELTIASYNLERFFDDVDDPAIGEPVLTAAAFDRRLAKASTGIRDFLRFPDIVGVAECENLDTLEALAARISADALAAGQADPLYAAYLMEGHDVGGIDVGFLVKTALVSGSVPRVEVLGVAQEGFETLFVNPDATTEYLNDRPSLRLEAIVNLASGESFPLTVFANHLRSLSGVNSESAGSNGWTTVGERVRAKRLQQAEELAGIVQARQLADPAEWMVLVGDFNAFELNDGFVDSLGTILGAPSPDDETVVPNDGLDLVEPDLVRLAPGGSYSYVYDGSAQSLDHALVDAALIAAAPDARMEEAHVNADFAEVTRNDDATVARLSDHDPLITYIHPVSVDPGELFRGDFETGDTRWWSALVP